MAAASSPSRASRPSSPRGAHHVVGFGTPEHVLHRHHPGDLVEVDAVLVARIPLVQTPGGNGVCAYADILALEILRRLYAGLYVVNDGGVVELAQHEDGQCRERFVVGLGGQVRRMAISQTSKSSVRHNAAEKRR